MTNNNEVLIAEIKQKYESVFNEIEQILKKNDIAGQVILMHPVACDFRFILASTWNTAVNNRNSSLQIGLPAHDILKTQTTIDMLGVLAAINEDAIGLIDKVFKQIQINNAQNNNPSTPNKVH